jgi:hypothetical protein
MMFSSSAFKNEATFSSPITSGDGDDDNDINSDDMGSAIKLWIKVQDPGVM